MLHCSACLCILLKEQQGDPRRGGNTAAVGWGAEVSWCGWIALWICSTNIDIGWKRILLSLVSILTIPATHMGSWPWIWEQLGRCSVPGEWQSLTPPWASRASDLQVIWHNLLRFFDAVQTRLENSHWGQQKGFARGACSGLSPAEVRGSSVHGGESGPQCVWEWRPCTVVSLQKPGPYPVSAVCAN